MLSTLFRKHFAAHPLLFYAMSMAASWAWGTSLVVGMQIVQERGLIPFLIWGAANSLALPLFGYAAFRIPKLDDVMKSKPIVLFTTVVQCFCIWIQMNAIYEILIKYNLAGETAAKIISIILATVFLLLLANNGLMRSITADQPIWSFCYLGLAAIVVIGFLSGAGFQKTILLRESGDINWALYTCLVLFSGPFMDIQNWEVARKVYSENFMKSYYLAGFLFMVYLAFVCILACLHFNRIMDIIIAVVILLVAVSTIDNAIVGVQVIAGKKVGITIAALCIALWQIVIPLGVMGLWLTMGTARIYVTAVCITISLLWYCNERQHD